MKIRPTAIAGLLLGAASLLTAQTTTAVVHGRYKFRSAGNVPGASFTVPFGIGKNHIVGYYYETATSFLNSYVQTGATFLSVAPFGSIDSYLWAVNRSGVAAGSYCVLGCNPYTGQHAYTYDYSTGVIASIDFPGAASTAAFGINDSGQVVGGYCSTSLACPEGANETDHAFLDDHGVFTSLDFPGAQSTQATGINNAGTIVGAYYDNVTGLHSFLYQNGVYATIDFPGGNYTSASAINNHGTVAGLFQDASGIIHGFVYANGSFSQIDASGAQQTALTAINDANDVVGVEYYNMNEQAFEGIPKRAAAELGQAPAAEHQTQ